MLCGVLKKIARQLFESERENVKEDYRIFKWPQQDSVMKTQMINTVQLKSAND